MLYTVMREELQHFFYENIYVFVFFFRKGSNLCSVRQTEGLLYWPIMSSLDPTMLRYHQDSTKHFCFLARDTQLEVAVGCWPLQALPMTASWHWFTLPPTLMQHLHISFHNTHNFGLTTWLLLLIYPGASYSEKSLIDSSVKGQYATQTRNNCLPITNFSFAINLEIAKSFNSV